MQGYTGHTIAGLEIEGSPHIAAALDRQGSLWIAVRSTQNTVHVLEGNTVRCTVHFPEDICKVEVAVASNSSGATLWLLVITAACRGWLLAPAGVPTPPKQHQADALAHPSGAAAQEREDAQVHCLECGPSARPTRLAWQTFEQHRLLPDHAADTASRMAAPCSHAALLLPSGGQSTSGCANIAAQAVWEHVLAGPPAAGPAGLFHDLSPLGRQHSKACAALSRPATSLPDHYSAQTWAAAELPASCGSTTALLHVQPAPTALDSSGMLRCSSRATLDPQLYDTLLRRQGGGGELAATSAGCLLAGDDQGRVWALPLGSHSALRATCKSSSICTERPTTTGMQGALPENGAHRPAMALLFELQQPVLAILPATMPGSSSEPSEPPGASETSYDALLIIGQCGRVVQLSVRAPAAQAPQPDQAQPSGRITAHGRLPSLAVQQMRIPAHVVCAATSGGVLYFTCSGTACAAALPERSAASGARSGSVQANSAAGGLRTVPVCHGAHTLAVAQGCQHAAGHSIEAAGLHAGGSAAGTPGGRLIMLCTDGRLVQSALLSRQALLAAQPPMSSGAAQAKMEVPAQPLWA